MKIKSTTVAGSVFATDNPAIKLPDQVHMFSICNNAGQAMARFVSTPDDKLYQLHVSVKEFEEDLSGDFVQLRIVRAYKLTENFPKLDVATNLRGGTELEA